MLSSDTLRIVRQTKANYNAIADDWNTSRSHPSGVKLRLIRPIKTNWRVLDIGCGNGLMTPEILKRGARYVGIDISRGLINIAKKKNKEAIKFGHAKFFIGDATKLPFQKNSFDFIFSFAVMHHVPSVDLRLKFLREIYRVLKPGSEAVINNWNLHEEWAENKYKINEQLKNPPIGYDAGDVCVPWRATASKPVSRYIHIFSDCELKDLAKKAEFKKIKIEYFNRAGDKIKNGESQILKIKK